MPCVSGNATAAGYSNGARRLGRVCHCLSTVRVGLPHGLPRERTEGGGLGDPVCTIRRVLIQLDNGHEEIRLCYYYFLLIGHDVV